VSLVDQWNTLETGLDPRWQDARLELRIDNAERVERALALLAPAGPGRSGNEIRFYVQRTASAIGPEAVRRLLRRLDEEGILGTLALEKSDAAPPAHVVEPATVASAWDVVVATLPADWSDLLCEIDLTSTDYIDRAALLMAPLNPYQTDSGTPGFQFRVARTFGYGASPGMVRRCLTRLDHDGIPGEVRVLRALSDSHPVGTQGPVWYVGGKAV
jgi:hypothetical protein